MKHLPSVLLLAGTALPTLTASGTNAPTITKQSATDSTEDFKRASVVADKFLKGVKIAELPEGKAMLADTAWFTREELSSLPVFSESKTLFEGMFNTDVSGVQGYKRLLELNALSKAGSPLLTHYLIVVYKSGTTQEWKVFSASAGTSLGSGTAVESDVEFFSKQSSEEKDSFSKSIYLLRLANVLMSAGRIRDAEKALETATTLQDSPEWVLSANKVRANEKALEAAKLSSYHLVDLHINRLTDMKKAISRIVDNSSYQKNVH